MNNDIVSHGLQFHTQGFTIFENALTCEELHSLRAECDSLINFVSCEKENDLVRDYGCVIEPLSCGFLDPPKDHTFQISLESYRKRRSIILENNAVYHFLQKCANIASNFLPVSNQTLYLYNEQYIVKPPRTINGSEFEWHQDSQYTSNKASSIACWTALDDINEPNGCIRILPYPKHDDDIPFDNIPFQSIAEYSSYHHHRAKFYTQNMKVDVNDVYPLIMKAGSILCMSNLVMHRSNGNGSKLWRRSFMPQFSTEILKTDQNELICMGVPFKVNNNT